MRFFAISTLLTACLFLGHATFGFAAEPSVGPDAAPFRQLVVQTARAIKQLEFTDTLTAVLNGSTLGPGEGWFKKQGQTRYDWNWLADRFDTNHDGRITREEFTGPRELFDRLDRDHDGVITKKDLDWSDSSPYWGQLRLATQLLRRADGDGDQKLSKEEWAALFKELAKGKEVIDAEDIRMLLYPPPEPRKPGPSDRPTKAILLKGLFNGELGSASEGPRLGDAAPDFSLPTQDGKKTITLSSFRGHKPVVLIFGSFT
jgi:Ca2+-binding EF-hand superfamily protein